MKTKIKTEIRITDLSGKELETISVYFSSEVVKRIKDISRYDTLTQTYLKTSIHNKENCIKQFIFN